MGFSGDDIEKKKKFRSSKNPIPTSDADINKIMIIADASAYDKNRKADAKSSIGYMDNKNLDHYASHS